MKERAAVAELISTYTKHGWSLRRVLLSEPESFGDASDVFGPAQVRKADIDALWFSRPSQPGTEAWELRSLLGSPFALLEVIPDETGPSERETILKDLEQRMRELLIKGTTRSN